MCFGAFRPCHGRALRASRACRSASRPAAPRGLPGPCRRVVTAALLTSDLYIPDTPQVRLRVRVRVRLQIRTCTLARAHAACYRLRLGPAGAAFALNVKSTSCYTFYPAFVFSQRLTLTLLSARCSLRSASRGGGCATGWSGLAWAWRLRVRAGRANATSCASQPPPVDVNYT